MDKLKNEIRILGMNISLKLTFCQKNTLNLQRVQGMPCLICVYVLDLMRYENSFCHTLDYYF